MLYRKKKIMEIDQKLVTDKCFYIRYYITFNNVANYFTKSSCSVTVKEDKVDIEIEEDQTYEAKCQYIAIDDVPSMFIIPEENPAMIDFLEKNQEIANKIYGLIILNWLEDWTEINCPLQNLYETFQSLYKRIDEALEEIPHCSMDFDDLPDEMINEIKNLVFDSYYDDTFYDILYNYGHEILKDLGLLPKNDDEYDEDDEYGEDNEFSEDDVYNEDQDTYSSFSRSKKNANIDLLQLYENNKEFAKEVDKTVNEHLRYIWWSKFEKNGEFKKEVVDKFLDNLMADNCDSKKVLNIVFHNEIIGILFRYSKRLVVNVNLGNTKIKSNFIITLKNKINIINWLHGSFVAIVGYPLLYGHSLSYSTFDYDDNACKEIHGKIKSYEVEYEEDEVNIGDVFVDCVAPRDKVIYIKAELKCFMRLDKQSEYLWFHNDRIILSRLIELHKIIDRTLRVHHSIGHKPLLVCGITTNVHFMHFDE